MKRRSKKAKAAPVREESIHFRLCHLCFNLNEAADEIHRCDKCGHDYHSISDYLMSDDVDMDVEAEEVEMVDENMAHERMRLRGGKRLQGLVAVL